MSDKEKFIELLESFGLKQLDADPDYNTQGDAFVVDEMNEVILLSGENGYNGFLATFCFTDDGKFIEHFIWE